MFCPSEPTPDAKAFVWYANKGIYAGVFVCTFFDGGKEKQYYFRSLGQSVNLQRRLVLESLAPYQKKKKKKI